MFCAKSAKRPKPLLGLLLSSVSGFKDGVSWGLLVVSSSTWNVASVLWMGEEISAFSPPEIHIHNNKRNRSNDVTYLHNVQYFLKQTNQEQST